MKKTFRIPAHQNNSSGFTLVELLVAIVITGFVITIAGSGLVSILQAAQRADARTDMRTDLNRALDFIGDDIRAANFVSNTSPSSPAWAWTELGGGSPQPKLYLKVPNAVIGMSDVNERITIPNNPNIANGNAVMFTGVGTVSVPLSKNQVYYVKNYDDSPSATDTFQVSGTIDGSAINFSTNSSGVITANQLIIYYTRDNTNTWLGPRTINRSAGNCTSPYQDSNCPVLIDSIRTDVNNGFVVTASSGDRQVSLSLESQTCLPLTNSNTCSTPETYQVNSTAFARSNLSP